MKVSYLDGRVVVVDQEEYLYFYGTSYLGLPYDPAFQSYLQKGQSQYGSSLGSSPLSSPQLSVYAELEECLAKNYGFQSALLFASGYAAGQAVSHIFQQEGYSLEYGNIAHPAIKLETNIKSSLDVNKSNSKTVFCMDFIDPISFERYELNQNIETDDKVLIDASHGFGLFDEEIISLSNQPNTLVCGSLNKALGINAGVVLGNTDIINQLRSTARYKTASAPSPAECFALLQAFNNSLVSKQQKHLTQLISNLRKSENLKTVHKFPVLTFRNNQEAFYQELKDQKILIWRNSYPSASSPKVNRAVMTAAHNQEDVDKLISLTEQIS